jgi:thiamine-phosphate pyrophosphorylase
MSAQLFLIAPIDVPAEILGPALKATLAEREVAALLLQRGALSENAYKTLVKSVAPMAQAAGAAVVIEGAPGLVRLLGADGLHVAGDIEAVREAVAALKPQMIVGVGGVHSRDDAMGAGELEVDYILFGPLSGAITADEREMARWWAETMEIPSVLSDPMAGFTDYDAEGCEFIGLGLSLPERAE